MKFIVKVLVAGFAVLFTAFLLSGVSIADNNYGNAIIAACLIAVLNATIKPILVIFTLPLTIITLGLFMLVINSMIILIADYFLTGFTVDNFFWALAFSLILSVINAILFRLVES